MSINEKARKVIELIGWEAKEKRRVYAVKDGQEFKFCKCRNMIKISATSPPKTTINVPGDATPEFIAKKLQSGFLDRLKARNNDSEYGN